MNPFQKELAHNTYFRTLPKYVQETIMQSSIQFHSEEELRTCAENLMRGN